MPQLNDFGVDTMEYVGNQHSRLYSIWNAMRQRCYNPKKQGYKYYGGRGICVCEEWRNNFSAFAEWALNNGYIEDAESYKCTIDRIDYNKDYSPENCRFVDMRVQNSNKRKYKGKLFEYAGEIHTLKEWAKILGTCYHTLNCRMVQYGWSFAQTVETPIRKSGKYKGKTD